jgi:hypothetical protein
VSEYFRVLKRLQAEDRDAAEYQWAPPARGEAPRVPAAEPSVGRAPQGVPAAPPRSVPLVSSGYATLYDNLRATANGHATRTVVFAGASATDPVRSVTEGLASHLQGLALRVVVMELHAFGGRPILRARPEACNTPPPTLESTPFDLRSHAGTAEVEQWLRQRTGDADIVLIEGTALAASIDSALLGCACDGLLLVARPGATPRDALVVAAERTRAVGCRTLGIVLYGADHGLPAWTRRFAHRYRPRCTAAEDQ